MDENPTHVGLECHYLLLYRIVILMYFKVSLDFLH
jgi:hypothetical protein